MKDLYIWRVIRDLSYSGAFVYLVYYIVNAITTDHHISLGEGCFVLFLLLGLIFMISEIEDEKKPRRFTVKIDGNEYQSDDYSLSIMKKGSHILMNGDEYVAIVDINDVEILRNPGHPDKKGHSIDLSEILKHAHEFAQDCQEHEAKSSDTGNTGGATATTWKRRNPNAGKKMSEVQKMKISQALRKRNAEKRATDKKELNLKK